MTLRLVRDPDEGPRPLDYHAELRRLGRLYAEQEGIIPARCTCGGNGICTACAIAKLEGSPVAERARQQTDEAREVIADYRADVRDEDRPGDAA